MTNINIDDYVKNRVQGQMRLHFSITFVTVIIVYAFCVISYKPGEILAFGLLFLVSMKNLFYVGRKLKSQTVFCIRSFFERAKSLESSSSTAAYFTQGLRHARILIIC